MRVRERLTFTLVPLLRKLVEHGLDLRELVLLVDRSQVSDHQVGERDGFRPAAIEFNDREFLLLAARIHD